MNTLGRKLCDGLSCDAEGTVVAVVAKLGVVDRDAEVITRDALPPGAYTEAGLPAIISGYGHSAIMTQISGAGVPVEAPVGKGTIHVEGDEAVFRGRYFSSARGQEAATVAREMGSAQSWSLTFLIAAAEPSTGNWKAQGARRTLTKIVPFEVSPVTMSAGAGTRTVSAKSASCGCGGGSSTHPTAAAVELVMADVKRTNARLQAMQAALAEPHGALALDIAERAVRWMTNGREHEPPVVKFFDFDAERSGYYTPADPDSIYISRGLSDIEVIRTTAHETAHWLRPWDSGEAVPRIEAQHVLNRYLATFERDD
jgi:hypothetical protein